MSSWLPSRARWPLGPGVRWEDDERALRQIGPSAFFRFLRALPSFPPRKRGPRNRGGAAATGMDLSAVDIPPARCLGGREKTAPSVLRRPWRFDVLLVAGQSSVVPGSRRSPGRLGVGKRGAQEPRWCRGHGADLSAVSFPPARCLGAREKTAPSVLRRPWRFDALLIAVQSPVVPGSRRSPGRRGVGKRGPRNRSGAAVTERTSAQRVLRRHDA